MDDETFYWKVLLLTGFGQYIQPENMELSNEAYRRWTQLSGKTAADIAFASLKVPSTFEEKA